MKGVVLKCPIWSYSVTDCVTHHDISVFYSSLPKSGNIFVYCFRLYETPSEFPAINGGDECGAGLRGMQSPSLLFKMSRGKPRGSFTSGER